MIKVSLYGDPPQKAKDYAQLLEIRQVSEPFCERLDNKKYMDDVKWFYNTAYAHKDIDASQINTEDEEKFVRSLVDIGQAEIFE
tara:strand:+ start:521 stop:772 length:252 start_codon:yes stop_codon:yes gene_type:complete